MNICYDVTAHKISH